MTAPTRRQIMAGSLAAVGAAGAPAIAIAADPRERVERAVAELEAAFRAYYTNSYVEASFNGVAPADMKIQPMPQWGPHAHIGAPQAGVLVFASIKSTEHGGWHVTRDDSPEYTSPPTPPNYRP